MSTPTPHDASMELACTLSPRPMSLRRYADDCGEATLHGVGARLNRLRRDGMKVAIDKQDQTAWVVTDEWPEFQRRCLEYWRRVYGE